MAGTIAPFPKHQFLDNNGAVAAGFKLHCYSAGSAPAQGNEINTYSDAALTTPNSNPIVLDSAGRATIFLDALSYKFVFTSPGDTNPPTSPIWTIDNVMSYAPFTATTINAFTTSGTWAKVSSSKVVYVTLIGSGGAGGSGARGAAGTVRGGGGGGGSAGYTHVMLPASILGTTEAVTVGTAPAGGAAQGVDSTAGNNGAAGIPSSFGIWAIARGGLPGVGGPIGAAGGAGGIGGPNSQFNGSAGGAGGDGTTAGTDGTTGIYFCGGGGGGGGGINAANTASNGGAGGNGSITRQTVAPGGTAGTSGAVATAGYQLASPEASGGGGGGGGAGNVNRAGANGGTFGGGGGGGGASLNGTASGAGGNGAIGFCLVMQL